MGSLHDVSLWVPTREGVTLGAHMKRDLRQCQYWGISSVWQVAGRSITPPHAPLSQWNEKRDHYLSSDDNLIYQTPSFWIYETFSASSRCVYHGDTVVIVFSQAQWKSMSHSLYIVCLCVFLWRDQKGLLIDLWEVRTHTHTYTHRHKLTHQLHTSPGCLSGLSLKCSRQGDYWEGPLS